MLLEVILAMGVTIILAMAVLAIGFLLSTVALGLALAIIAIIFLAATGVIALGLLAALALGFLGTLIPPLIPILPIILVTVIAVLIYGMANIIFGLTEAATEAVATTATSMLEALGIIIPQ